VGYGYDEPHSKEAGDSLQEVQKQVFKAIYQSKDHLSRS
jgi:hypothetical protein